MRGTHYPVDGFTAYVDTRYNTRVHHNAPHEHSPYFELLYFIEGESRVVIDGVEHRARGGDLVVYHPWTVHEEFVQPGPYRLICIRFNRGDIERSVPFPSPEQVGVVFRLPWKERFQNLFEQIVIETEQVDQWSSVLRGAYLTQFIALLWRALSYCRDSEESGNEQACLRIAHVIDLIHNGIRTDLSLAELAEKAFMSESHFSHVFKDVTGVPPKRYLIAGRVAKAKELLTTTARPVIDIAAELGYDNPQYFSRMFKKETGRTPLEFRRHSRKVH